MKTINRIVLFLLFLFSFLLSLPIIIGEFVSEEDAREGAFMLFIFLFCVVIVVGVATLFIHYDFAQQILNLYHEVCSKLTWT